MNPVSVSPPDRNLTPLLDAIRRRSALPGQEASSYMMGRPGNILMETAVGS